MARGIAIVSGLCLCLAVALGTWFPGPQVASGQELAPPVTVGLGSPREAYVFGEPVVVTVTISNTSSRTQRVAPFGPYHSSMQGLWLVQDGGDPAPLSGLPLLAADVLVLDPQDCVTMAYAGLYLGPGKHSLRAEVQFMDPVTAFGSHEHDLTWQGCVVSEPLSIEILDQALSMGAREQFGSRMDSLVAALEHCSAQRRESIVDHIAWYMPITGQYLGELLEHPDPQVRGAAARAIGRLAKPVDGDLPRRERDVSLLENLLELAQAERSLDVRRATAEALGWAADSLSDEQRQLATDLVGSWLAQRRSDALAGTAADGCMSLDPSVAARLIRERMEEPYGQEDDFMALLESALERRTGTREVEEGLKRLEQQGE